MTASTLTTRPTQPIQRTPRTITIGAKAIAVEQLLVQLPFARKPYDLSEVASHAQDECRDTVLVTETRQMTPAEFDSFTSALLQSRDWLAGRGGYAADARLCVEICAPGRPTLFVDPSGGDYPRYVARLG